MESAVKFSKDKGIKKRKGRGGSQAWSKRETERSNQRWFNSRES